MEMCQIVVPQEHKQTTIVIIRKYNKCDIQVKRAACHTGFAGSLCGQKTTKFLRSNENDKPMISRRTNLRKQTACKQRVFSAGHALNSITLSEADVTSSTAAFSTTTKSNLELNLPPKRTLCVIQLFVISILTVVSCKLR